MTLESAIGVDEFMLDLYGMYVLINKEGPSHEEEDLWG